MKSKVFVWRGWGRNSSDYIDEVANKVKEEPNTI